MKKLTLLDRILYHLKKYPESNFSKGYITAAEDSSKLRNRLSSDHYKNRINDFSKKKVLSNQEKSLLSLSKGYIAFTSDLKK